jgi:hypothetical protein
MKNLLILAFFLSNTAFAQVGSASPMLTDNMGRVLKPSNATFVDGSPYLSPDWMKGSVSSNGDKIFTFKAIRFNLMENQVEHEYNNQMYALSDEIKEFEIEFKNENEQILKKKFRKNFAAIGDFTAKTFYEILYDGDLKFLKKTSVRVSSHPKPLSNQMERSYFQTINYFLCDKEGKMRPLLKGKTEVFMALNPNEQQKTALEALIKKEKLSLKIEDDIIYLVMYFNQNLL